jgi:hypothetical protein
MDLIELYVKEVGQHLPEKSREDIEKEIRSLIEDTLEDESSTAGKPVDEAMVVDILKRLGPPEKMAANYQPPRYLIGPRLFPKYTNVLRIVLSVVSVVAAVSLGVSMGFSARAISDVPGVVTEVISGLFQAIFQAAAIVTLVFAIMEWANPMIKLNEKDWDPRKMHSEPEGETIKPAGHIGQIVASIVALIFFNMYPQWIGFSSMVNGVWQHAPLLAPPFFQYLPWISLLWALDASLSIVLLARGHWQPSTRWFKVGLSAASIVLLGWMLVGPALTAINPQDLSRLGWENIDPATMKTSSEAMNNAVRMVIGIIMAMNAVELLKDLYRLVIRGRVAIPVH